MNDELDAGAFLERLGEIALLAPGNDVVVEGLQVPVGDDGNPKGGVLATVLEVRLVAGLLTVPKRVMVCWVCMVFLLLPGHSGHTSRRGAKVRCSQVAAQPRCQEKKF